MDQELVPQDRPRISVLDLPLPLKGPSMAHPAIIVIPIRYRGKSKTETLGFAT